jgi:hypothetical protein
MVVKNEEENKNGGEQNSKSGVGVTKGTGNKRKRNTGNKAGDTGNSGTENGEHGGQIASSGEETGNSREDAKRRILDKLKRERDERSSGNDDNEHQTVEGKSTGDERGDGGVTDGTSGIDRIDTGQVAKRSGVRGKPAIDGSSSDGNSADSETTGRKLKFDLPKFEKPINKEKVVVDVKESQLEKELTKKESNDLQPRIENALREIFKGVDKLIDFTTKTQMIPNVTIWSSIEDSEITVIAVAMLETGQRSKVVSTITRRMANDYTKLQMGIITLPRFIETYKHYMANGFGFGFIK